MALLRKYSLQIDYNGRLFDLLSNLEKVKIALGKNNNYNKDIDNIINYIIPKFDFYSKFMSVFVGSIVLKNSTILNTSRYYWSKLQVDDPINIYSKSSMDIFYSILLIFVIIFIVMIVFSYLYNLRIDTYIVKLLDF
uniref:Uncharacterized protein n=1 Tax=viral metagenome TaxID=1070528 RepID=A0A6C0BCF9_9ZZZZ